MTSLKLMGARTFLSAGMLSSMVYASPIIVDISSTNGPGTRGAVLTLDSSQSVAYNDISWGSTSTPSRNTIANLVDTTGAETGITLTVLTPDVSPTPGGTRSLSSTAYLASTPAASLFSGGMMQSFVAAFNSAANRTVDYGFTGLDVSSGYDFSFLCTRDANATDTVVTLVGATTTTKSILTTNNTALLTFDNVLPDASGQIVVSYGSPAAVSLYSPMNVFQFEKSTIIPEPASLAMLMLGGLLGLRRRHS